MPFPRRKKVGYLLLHQIVLLTSFKYSQSQKGINQIWHFRLYIMFMQILLLTFQKFCFERPLNIFSGTFQSNLMLPFSQGSLSIINIQFFAKLLKKVKFIYVVTYDQKNIALTKVYFNNIAHHSQLYSTHFKNVTQKYLAPTLVQIHTIPIENF